jgi:voltage-gated potassium channel
MSALLAAVCLVLATAAVHVSGLYILLRRLYEIGAEDLTRRGPLFFLQVLLLLTLSVVMLHMIEVWIWAAFYRAAVGFDDWPTAVYFSLGCYSTVGTEPVLLPREWRLLGGMEAMLGALMFGLSTAFLFAVVHEIHTRRRESAREKEAK